jgi:hypothetical protein
MIRCVAGRCQAYVGRGVRVKVLQKRLAGNPNGVRWGNADPQRKEPAMASTPFEFAARWRQLSEEIMAGIQERRLQHPKATLRKIEAAINERLATRLERWHRVPAGFENSL